MDKTLSDKIAAEAAIKELLALADKATPEPWLWLDDYLVSQAQLDENEGNVRFVPTPIITTDGGQYGPRAADREFIAAARNAIPAIAALSQSLAARDREIEELALHRKMEISLRWRLIEWLSEGNDPIPHDKAATEITNIIHEYFPAEDAHLRDLNTSQALLKGKAINENR